MRRVLSLLTLVGVACAPRNYHREISSTVPNGRDVMQCALAEARRLGYEVVSFSETASPTTFRALAVTLVNGGNGREPHYLEPTANALADQGRVVSSCVKQGD